MKGTHVPVPVPPTPLGTAPPTGARISLLASILSARIQPSEDSSRCLFGDEGSEGTPVPPVPPAPQGNLHPSAGKVSTGPSGRRLFSDDKRLKQNRGADIEDKHPLTMQDQAKMFKARLSGMARTLGLPGLPGEGSLSLATRYLPAGRDTFLQYVQLAAQDGDLACQTWWHVYHDLKPWERKLCTPDDICAASGVSPVKLLQAVVGVAYAAQCDIANLVAAQLHPKVVERSARFAQHFKGIEDRKLMFQHHKFIPTPKGTQINILNQGGQGGQAQAVAAGAVPSFLSDVQETHEAKKAVQDGMLLPEHAEAPVKTLSELEEEFNSEGEDTEDADEPVAVRVGR